MRDNEHDKKTIALTYVRTLTASRGGIAELWTNRYYPLHQKYGNMDIPRLGRDFSGQHKCRDFCSHQFIKELAWKLSASSTV